MKNKKPKLSIIIATMNEEEGIGRVLSSIPASVRKISEVIVVDSSTDKTPQLAKRLGARVITEKRKGKGLAMKTGVAHSRGEILVFLDGDGTDPPQFIPKMLKKLEQCEIVFGSRTMKDFKEDDPHMRRIFKFYDIVVAKPLTKILGMNIKGDPLAGFRMMRRKHWERMGTLADDFTIETEMNIRAKKLGLRIAEVPIPNLKRGGGLRRSKFVHSPKMWVRVLELALKSRINGN